MGDHVGAQQIRCPACAAPVEAPPGDVLRCKYCGIESRIGRVASSRGAVAEAEGGTRTPVLFITVVVLAIGFAGWWLLFAGDDESREVSQPDAIAKPVSTPALPPTVEPPPVPAAVEPVAPERPPMEDMFSPTPAPGSIAVRWTAKVKKTSGRSRRGVACEIDGWVVDRGDSIRPLDVRCKGDLLYSSTQKFSGTADMSTGATTVSAKDGSPRWLLRYNDTGSRSDRAQIRLDSAARIGRVWSDALPPWDIELTIEPDGVPKPE